MKKHYNLNVTEDNGESVTTSNTSTEHASEILRIMKLAGITPEAIEEHGEAEMQYTPANDELDLDDYSKKSPESIAKQKKSIQPSHGDNPLEYSLDENEIFETLMAEFKSEMLEEGTCPECGGKKHKLMACSSCGCSESIEEEVVNELNVPNDKEKVIAQIRKLDKMADEARANDDPNKAMAIERGSEMTALYNKLEKLGGDPFNIPDANDDWVTPEGGPLSYKKVGEYTYIVKDENGEEHKAEMGAMGDEQDNYSGDEIEQTMDQEGLQMLIRQAKKGAPTKESAPMGEYTDKEFACINIDTGEYGYCDKDELHKYTHMVPAKEFTYFDAENEDMDFSDFDDELADQEGWTKIASNESAPMGEYTDKEFACINIDTGEYGYCDKDELHKYTHMVPAKEFTYFDAENEDMNFADFDDELADQEGWTKIASNESAPMGEYTDKEFACINIDTGEYGYCDKDELHKYTHYVPAKEFTYFDAENEDMDFSDFDDELADQEGWEKIPTNEMSEELSYMKKLAGL